MEAGLSPDFTELENLDYKLLLERAWNDYLLKVRLGEPQRLSSLKELDITPGDLKEAYRQLCLYPDGRIYLDALGARRQPDPGPLPPGTGGGSLAPPGTLLGQSGVSRNPGIYCT